MDCITFTHHRGSRQTACDEFPLVTGLALLLGRDPAAQVWFDPTVDDLVGRQHARVVHEADSGQFTLEDLDARNGTFLNRHRILGRVPLRSGDVIQLGAGGPELEFRLRSARNDCDVTSPPLPC